MLIHVSIHMESSSVNMYQCCNILERLKAECSVFCVISGFHHRVDENCALLGFCAASSFDFLLKFCDKLLVPTERVSNL